MVAATAVVIDAAAATSIAAGSTTSNSDLEQGVVQKQHAGWDHIEKAKEFLDKGLISQADYDDLKDTWLEKLKGTIL